MTFVSFAMADFDEAPSPLIDFLVITGTSLSSDSLPGMALSSSSPSLCSLF